MPSSERAPRICRSPGSAEDDFIDGEGVADVNDGEADGRVICWPLAMTKV